MSTSLPKVLYFTRPRCSACKAMSPSVNDTAIRFIEDVELVHVDVAEKRPMAAKYMVYGVPTLVVVADDKVIGRSVGSVTNDQLVSFFAGARDLNVTGTSLTTGERALRLGVAAAIAGIAIASEQPVVVLGAFGFVAYAFADRLPRFRR